MLTLSPCVLPPIAVLLATGIIAHWLGRHAAALALALAGSFIAVGILLAAVSACVGLDPSDVRIV